MNKNIELSQELRELLEYVQSLFSKEVWVVGGCVRDIVMNNTPKDYDFCTKCTPEEIKGQLKGKHKAILIGEKHGTIMFHAKGKEIEITTLRKEIYTKQDGRKPIVSYDGVTIEQDLSRRDYTINSMCINCTNFKLTDPYNGREDIKNGLIKCVGIAKHRFKEDPLRILRGIRFAARYGFEFEKVTLARIKDMSYSLLRISKERWVMELDKILLDKNVYLGLKMLWECNIFKFIIPELQLQWKYDQNSRYHNLELWEHTTKVVESAQKAGEPIEMLWSCLLHDIGKPATRTDKEILVPTPSGPVGYLNKKTIKSNYVFHELVGGEIAYKICTYLKFSKDRTTFIVDMIRHHLEKDCPLKIYDDQHKSKLAGELDKK